MSFPLPLTFFDYSQRQDAPPVWPLPMLGPHNPIVLGPGERWHSIVLGYDRRVRQPDLVPVLAVGNGEITLATDSHVGIHHHNGFETHYAQLAEVLMTPRTTRARKARQYVRAGDVIGFIAAGARLPFEIWRRKEGFAYTTVPAASHIGHWRDVDCIELPQVAA